jgi:hypothetical protein
MENFNDEIVTNADLKFYWRDRLRILFGRVVFIEVRIRTENKIGYAQAGTMVHVEPIFGKSEPAPLVSNSQSRDALRMDKIEGMDHRPQRSFRGLGPAPN